MQEKDFNSSDHDESVSCVIGCVTDTDCLLSLATTRQQHGLSPTQNEMFWVLRSRSRSTMLYKFKVMLNEKEEVLEGDQVEDQKKISKRRSERRSRRRSKRKSRSPPHY